MTDFDAAANDGRESTEGASGTEDTQTLRPSVRRLIKQYGLDAAAIQGSGPGGRIGVADVMAVLGGRAAAPAQEDADETGTHYAAEEPPDDPLEASLSSVQTARSFARHHPATTLFECDLTSVLTHQRRTGGDNGPPSTAYYAFALMRALAEHVEHDALQRGDLGVVTSSDGGGTRALLFDQPLELTFEALGARLRNCQPEEMETADDATWLIHHHGLTGSIAAMPTPLGERQQFSLGIGKARRIVAIKNVDGAEQPRAITQCYLSLSFHPDEIDLQRANRLLDHCVRTLENWPVGG